VVYEICKRLCGIYEITGAIMEEDVKAFVLWEERNPRHFQQEGNIAASTGQSGARH